MPFIEASTTDAGLRSDVAQPPALPPEGNVAAAAFRQNNTVYSAISAIHNSGVFEPDPTHNPLDVIKGTPYEAGHLSSFVGSRSDGETRSIMRRIDQEENDRRVLEAGGTGGVLLSMVAGSLDPTMAMPGGMAVVVGKEGYAIGRAAVAGAGAFAAQSAVQEAGLQASQVTRTVSESLLNVGSATILGSLLGPAARLLSPAEHTAAVALVDRERAAMDAHAAGPPAPAAERPPTAAPPLIPDFQSGPAPGFTRLYHGGENPTSGGGRWVTPDPVYARDYRPGSQVSFVDIPSDSPLLRKTFDDSGTDQVSSFVSFELPEELAKNFKPIDVSATKSSGLSASLSAAGTDARQLKPVTYGLDKVPGVAGAVERTDPMLRLFGSESVTARRTTADLAETPLLMQENLQGIPTTQGPALDRIARMEMNSTRVDVSDTLDRLFTEYRYGDAKPFAPQMRAQAQSFLGTDEGKMTYAEFKAQVSQAMQEGDKHAIPQIQQAAEYVRNRVFEPWKNRAIEAGLFPEDLAAAPKGSDSYLHRVYNKQAIAAKRPDFINRVTDYLKGDQSTKAAAQERIAAYHGALKVAQDRIDKASARIETLSRDAEVVQARQEEATRVNKFAFQRSVDLRESQFKNDGGIRVPVPDKNIEKARGGAPFETNVRNRGNTLADRASGKLAEIDSLEQKLAKEVANHDAMRAKIEKEIGDWNGQSVREAKAALKAREKYAATREPTADPVRLTSADSAIDTAVKRIVESQRDLSEQELRARANEITDRIIGSPDGRLSYDVGSGGPSMGPPGGEAPRGPLAARKFAIPDAMIRDYLEKDIEHIVNAHVRTMIPDVLLTERFGDVNMTEAFRKINDEYAALVEGAKSEKARTKLEKERQGVIRDIAAIRDRTRHVYGIPPEGPLRQVARVTAAVKNFNVVTSMGMAAVSSLTDLAGPVFRHGLTAAFNDAWSPFISGMMGGTAYKEAKSQFRAMGIATETTLAQRAHSLSDTMDAYRPQSRLERTLQWGADKFQIANILAPWTDWAKTTASMIASSEILRASKAVVEGKATKRQLRTLGESGIDATMAQRIHTAFTNGGEIRDGVHLPNTADWTDLTARRALEGAVARDADIAVITPGAEKPLWLSDPVLSVFGQFKSFTAASTQRILIANLQRRDAQVLQGLLTSMGMGMLSYKLNSLTGGAATSDRPQDWIKEAMSRGAVLGWLEEGNSIASKATRGGVDIYRLIGADRPASRFVALSAKDQLLGPTAGKIEALLKVTSAGASRDWTHSDTTALRRLMVGQNLFYLRGLFNQVEQGANNAFNIPAKAEPKK